MFKQAEKRRAKKRVTNGAWQRSHPANRNMHRRNNYKEGAKNKKNFRSNWTIQEHNLIIDPKRPCDRVLAEQLGRTVQAIQAERCRLRKKNI